MQTSRKVAGSIPDVTDLSIDLILPATLCSWGRLSNLRGGGEGRLGRKTNLTTICEPTVYKMCGASTSHNPTGLDGLLRGNSFTFTRIQGSRREAGSPVRSIPVVRVPADSGSEMDLHGHVSGGFGLHNSPVRVMKTRTELPRRLRTGNRNTALK
jgi:hypothetical protein